MELDGLKVVKDLNEELNKWDYGVLINGRVIRDQNKIDWHKYRTTPIQDMKKYHVGVCWDFVNFQHDRFKVLGIPDKSYLVVIQTGPKSEDIVTHTFSIVRIGYSYYWFESSWMKHQGVHKVSSYKDVVNVLLREYGRHPYDVYEYNPDGLDKKLGNIEFFTFATRNLIDSTI